MRTLFNNGFLNLTGTRLGILLAWFGVMIYAASNSIATLIVDMGAAQPLADGSNPITFAGLLLLGSIISLIPMAVLFRKDWTRANLRALGRRDWGLLTVSACLSSALTPGLFFFALEHSSVTSVVLVSRIEPPLFLIAAFLFLRERIEPRVFMAGLVALVGAVLMIGMRCQNGDVQIGMGEIAAVGATLSYVASTIVTRRALGRIPMGIFSIYRTAVGTVIYFLLVLALMGPQQFAGIASPVMLKWVWVYAVIVVVIGQLVWFMALRTARSGDISLATSFSPLAAIIFAMLLLGEDPGAGLLPGGSLILLGIWVGQAKSPTAQRMIRVVARYTSPSRIWLDRIARRSLVNAC